MKINLKSSLKALRPFVHSLCHFHGWLFHHFFRFLVPVLSPLLSAHDFGSDFTEQIETNKNSHVYYLSVFLRICCLSSVATFEFIPLNSSIPKKTNKKTITLSLHIKKYLIYSYIFLAPLQNTFSLSLLPLLMPLIKSP